MTNYLTTDTGRRIAYERLEGQGPGIVFLGGFRSDMQGSKVVHLRDWAAAQGRAFLRFDYSGHGASDGVFEEGCIGDWAADARAAIEALTQGPQVLVGSSMGGWISLLMARTIPDRVAGLVTIAAAPDFTESGFWVGFSPGQREALMRDGRIALPSEYGEPLVVTRRLIEDGRDQLVLNQPLSLPFPARMLQGTADADVQVSWAMDLLDHASGEDLRLTLVKGADHRFSSPDCLDLIVATIEEVVQNVRE
ncbi:alpha/beta hydrolase [Paracoccus haeundaensis]|uniref:Palmitoyl-protein thioesterase ABHD10, mitochondrial n=1 Tax=Paracoccus haeundaensis TaxID=225362 RepID=A0A5C4RAK9_9RHOB|nr:alpha/beta hydrolase [Paracoccus haeundaensis]TNH40932.1 alpha/beta hydrolase [Paracoccus haeundaensis]